MCLIVFDWRPDAPTINPDSRGCARFADWPVLRLTANRDEALARLSAPMVWWQALPGVLAGRDLQAGGTWLGLHRNGRFAALTNYRAPSERLPRTVSRGALVADFLSQDSATWGGPTAAHGVGDATPLSYLHHISATAERYNGFNLLVGDLAARQLAWFSNRSGEPPKLLRAGLYGLSNAFLDTPWPKVLHRKAALAALAPSRDDDLEGLLDLMNDRHIATDQQLPATGVSLQRERALSAAYIDLPEYGTRSTTALRADSGGKVSISERSDDDGTHQLVRPGRFLRHFDFQIEASAS